MHKPNIIKIQCVILITYNKRAISHNALISKFWYDSVLHTM